MEPTLPCKGANLHDGATVLMSMDHTLLTLVTLAVSTCIVGVLTVVVKTRAICWLLIQQFLLCEESNHLHEFVG